MQSYLNQTALKLSFLAVAMFAFGYAMVPLYEKICQVTGIRNLLNPQADNDEFLPDLARQVRVEFDTNARGMLAMTPSMKIANLHPGETYSVVYTLENLSPQPLSGQAIPSYSPRPTARWFKKIQCFCFDQLHMQPHEVRQVPVVFVIDPQMPDDIETLSLSYTFFEVEGHG